MLLYDFFPTNLNQIIQSRKVTASIFSKKRQIILAIKLERKAVYSKADIQKIILVFSDMNYKQKEKKKLHFQL